MTERAILLVDDDSDLREALTEQLALYDEFAITQEESAAAGIKTARENHTDLLIMDVGLPDMDGREAVKLLRKGGFKSPITAKQSNRLAWISRQAVFLCRSGKVVTKCYFVLGWKSGLGRGNLAPWAESSSINVASNSATFSGIS